MRVRAPLYFNMEEGGQKEQRAMRRFFFSRVETDTCDSHSAARNASYHPPDRARNNIFFLFFFHAQKRITRAHVQYYTSYISFVCDDVYIHIYHHEASEGTVDRSTPYTVQYVPSTVQSRWTHAFILCVHNKHQR